MIPTFPTQTTDAGNEHILEFLADLVVGAHERPDTDPEKEIERFSAHLATCEQCRAGLALLLKAQAERSDLSDTDRSGFSAMVDRIASLVHTTPIADSEALAAFAEVMMVAGEEAARQRFPAFAAHLDRCQECREDLASFLELLAQAQAAGLFGAASVVAAQSGAPAQEQVAPDALWLPSGQGILRLREALTILVGQATVAVVGAVPGIRSFESPVQPAMRSRDPALGREERLIFTIRTSSDGSLTMPNWLRVSLELSARLDRRLKVTLRAESLMVARDLLPDPEQAGEPESGLAWRVELLDGATRRLAGRGATDDSGIASFPLPDPGHYELTLARGGQSWEIPLEMRYQPASD